MHTPPIKPAEHAETHLLHLILSGTYPAGADLPAERDLATQLGVTRPTLREALQRLSRDGWLRIQHGKPTRVNDYLTEGGLAILGRIAQHGQIEALIPQLLEVRAVLAPAYTEAAVRRAPDWVADLLSTLPSSAPDAYAAYDWALHKTLVHLSGNVIYPLILNGFAGVYATAGAHYFASPEARDLSTELYGRLRAAALDHDGPAAAHAMRDVLTRSMQLWHAQNAPAAPPEATP
ncbi:fatty acid metabolism transcriptional regulator FadR [Deinococcus maricopensis]|uniref:Regulatory protein GntR HTH n=1 Tax=Deinococcus maricopensis (strain DSM 21211 / LMG 22137 / NRRL B-23946 / LB-34) TaxID=709986 RepID=E8U3R6_DEIML|nr:fatty acid metabolism transcriptional regulator FadR [Deinococcus maricopensis]ADV68759.1 regulatory protein GntR HTH [Deinococcus maricopensis DSM 21211]